MKCNTCKHFINSTEKIESSIRATTINCTIKGSNTSRKEANECKEYKEYIKFKIRDMEMPVPCDRCEEWVDLHSTRQAETDKNKLYCRECYEIDEEVDDAHQRILDIEYDLDNGDESVKGRKRELKKEIKELKARIEQLGYEYEEL